MSEEVEEIKITIVRMLVTKAIVTGIGTLIV